MIVEYKLSFEHFLWARNESQQIVDDRAISFDTTRAVIILLACVGLMALNSLSAVVIASGILMIFGAITARHYWRLRVMTAKLRTLRSDYEKFSSGSYKFEADEKGWRLSSNREEQVHSWEEVQMVRNAPEILYLMTHSGACTLPKAVFSAEQLGQLEAWYESAMSAH